MNSALLRVEALTVKFDGVKALERVSFALDPAQLVAVVGPNAAGKSTLARTLMGMVAPVSGKIWLDDEPLNGRSTRERVRRGVALVPEGRGVIGSLSVWDNLLLGTYALPRSRRQINHIEVVVSKFPILKSRRHQLAGTLSGGEQQLLVIARGLLSQPRVLILDEPLLGLSPSNANQVLNVVKELSDHTAILLLEQSARTALRIADRAHLLKGGELVYSGCADDLMEAAVLAEMMGINEVRD